MARQKELNGENVPYYNLRLGPVFFTANAGLGIGYVDNLNLTSTDKVADLILEPSVGITAAWQISRLNSIDLHTTIGYTKYLDHPKLDSQTALISPDSQLRFNLYVGDFKIVLHEQFSLEDDPVPQGSVSGVATFGRFTNTAGVSVLWDLNDVIWSIGYDHYTFTTTGQASDTNGSLNDNLSALDHSTDQLSTSAVLKINPVWSTGLEATAAYSRYQHNSAADSSVLSGGPFIDIQVTPYTRFNLSAGYELYNQENSSNPATTPDLVTNSATNLGNLGIITATNTAPDNNSNNRNGSGYYANAGISHRLNSFYSDRLSAGRDFQIGLLSDRTETTFVNYSSTWVLNRQLSLNSSVFYETVHETNQFTNSFGADLGDYRLYGATLATAYQLTRKMTISLSYQITRRTSTISTEDYTQNRIALQVGYQF